MLGGSQADVDVRHFAQGEVLFYEGNMTEVMYVIQEGAVRLSKEIEGVATTLATLRSGDLVGEVGLVRHRAQTATATALEATRCIAIDSTTLEHMVTADGEIAVRVIKVLADGVAAAHELMATVGERDARTEVCLALARHAEMSKERTGEGVLVRKRLGDLAEEVGVTDAEMGEISKLLMRAHLLRIKRDGILVPDVARLYEFVKPSEV